MRQRSSQLRRIQPIPDFPAGSLHLLKGVPPRMQLKGAVRERLSSMGQDQAHELIWETWGSQGGPSSLLTSGTAGHAGMKLCPWGHSAALDQPLSAAFLSGMQCRTHPCKQTWAGKPVLNHTEITSWGNLCSTRCFLGQPSQSMSVSHCRKSTVLQGNHLLIKVTQKTRHFTTWDKTGLSGKSQALSQAEIWPLLASFPAKWKHMALLRQRLKVISLTAQTNWAIILYTITKLSADNLHQPRVQTGATSPQYHQLRCPFPNQDSCTKQSSTVTLKQPNRLKITEFREKFCR